MCPVMCTSYEYKDIKYKKDISYNMLWYQARLDQDKPEVKPLFIPSHLGCLRLVLDQVESKTTKPIVQLPI